MFIWKKKNAGIEKPMPSLQCDYVVFFFLTNIFFTNTDFRTEKTRPENADTCQSCVQQVVAGGIHKRFLRLD